MKFWQVVALAAVAAIPVLLLAKRENPARIPVPEDPDDIFGYELRVD